MVGLVECMNDAFSYVPSTEYLLKIETENKSEGENIRRCVDLMLRQTIECGNFIKKAFNLKFG